MSIIEDGSGKGYSAAVNQGLKLATTAITFRHAEYHAALGSAYNINTSNITLTGGGSSALLYF